MLRVLTGELSGLVEGGRPTKVTLLPSNPPFPGLGSFLVRSSDDLQTMVQNLAQTVISKEENKVDSMVAVKRFFRQTIVIFTHSKLYLRPGGRWMHYSWINRDSWICRLFCLSLSSLMLT